jgi:L-lactate dehydrogenase
VFVQVLDPEAFGGRDTFVRQTSWLADACRAATPRPGGPGVRLPGERGLRMMREQRANGVALEASILPALERWAAKLDVAMPAPR